MTTYRMTRTWSAGGDTLSKTEQLADGLDIRLDEEPAGAAPVTYDLPLDGSKLKALFVLCDRPLTLTFNNAGSGANVDIVLTNDVPVQWSLSSGGAYFANPLPGNYDNVTVSAPGAGVTAELEIRLLSDA